MCKLYIEQFDKNDVERYGMCITDYGVFDNKGHCYFYGSLNECEKWIQEH